ncbi:MAG TPA: hypothetical protein PKX48_00940 [Planctomycetota bacterium]|jgi:hypothetical protein|nr:hypothetical protein [Planctomycetota bacterium]OQC21984.1 MAG: hypothetical protein BWX69_00292 [Planctomycetes bacterium ADurb.Bin069]NMD35869.1 hypothetical protein [Planctomycetota bacterium]HNR98132.1 hypothetical protein [Planctomycetota bacterium]HNU25505.1 hypothetical protein [Planctomycetota bacterium]
MTDKNPEDVEQDAAEKREEGPPTVVLGADEIAAQGAEGRKVAWDEADEIPVDGDAANTSGALSTGALSFDTEALGAGNETEEEIPVVVAAGPEAETMMSEALSSATALLAVTESAEEVGLLGQNPGFKESAPATATAIGEGMTDVALDDITEDLGLPGEETIAASAPAARPQRAPAERVAGGRRSGGRARVFVRMSALAAAIVAAVLLWPQWGPYVTEGVSSAIAYYTPNEAPKAAAKAPVEPVVSAPAVAPEAVTTAVAAAVPPSGAAAVAAGYRRSWDAVISLSLGLKAGGSASGDPSTK